MKLEASTIDELFEAAGDRGDQLRAIDELIVEHAPQLRRRLVVWPSICMIGYGDVPSGELGADGEPYPVLGLTAQRHHIALYAAGHRDGEPIAQYYQGRLGASDNGKGCIRFRSLDRIDRDELAAAIRDSQIWATEPG